MCSFNEVPNKRDAVIPRIKPRFAWKVFALGSRGIDFQFHWLYDPQPLKIGVWFKEPDGRGFHVWTTKKAAQAWTSIRDDRVVIRVRVRGRIFGMGGYGEKIRGFRVAEMRVPESARKLKLETQ